MRSLHLINDARYILSRAAAKMRPTSIRNSTIHRTSKIEYGSQIVNSNFDRYSYCGHDCKFLNADIGSFCSISDNVFAGGSSHPMHFVSMSPIFLFGRDSVSGNFSKFEHFHMPRTIIGSDVWIGFAARIRAGVHIGHGSVVAMGAVVTRNVPPYSVVGGNPAKVLRQRFDSDTIDGLLATQWWSFTESQLKEWSTWFNDPKQFLERWARR